VSSSVRAMGLLLASAGAFRGSAAGTVRACILPRAELCSPVKRSARNGKMRFMIDASMFPALETLLAVARTGSVGAAARQRHGTSPAVGQQIRRLEAPFGIKLLERAGRGVRLTAAGETALPVVRELWSGAETAFGQLAELAGQPSITLRLAVSDYLGKG